MLIIGSKVEKIACTFDIQYPRIIIELFQMLPWNGSPYDLFFPDRFFYLYSFLIYAEAILFYYIGAD